MGRRGALGGCVHIEQCSQRHTRWNPFTHRSFKVDPDFRRFPIYFWRGLLHLFGSNEQSQLVKKTLHEGGMGGSFFPCRFMGHGSSCLFASLWEYAKLG